MNQHSRRKAVIVMKQTIKWILSKITIHKKVTIVKKMILGYVMLVFLPVVIFGSTFLYLSYKNVIDNISVGKQSLLNQSANSLTVSLTQVESTYPLFQNNPLVLDYLTGLYQSEGDQVYHFLKDIRPVFSFAYTANESIKNVRLYKTNKNIMPIFGEIEDIDSFPSKQVYKVIDETAMAKGSWIPLKQEISNIPYISYYKKIYDDKYSQQLAILEVIVNDQILDNFIQSIDSDNKAEVIIVRGSNIFYQSKGIPFDSNNIWDLAKTIKKDNKSYLYWNAEKLLVNSVNLPKLGLDFYFFSPKNEVIPGILHKTLLTGILLLVLLFFLSAIYYVTASILTSRVLKLASHMKKVDQNNLTQIDVEGYEDELGYLTTSYNSMIQRIHELINKVNLAELMKKEADYLVMQAQIKPHFLYNTLESIRMMAEINDDQEVVEATYTFGKLLRYSLSPGGNEISLNEEVENIIYFLKIHKIRMMDRLQYDIQVDCNIDQIRCPRFILQPLVENSIGHGIAKKRKQGTIKIHIYHEEPYLHITISDNGAGIPADRLETIRGVLSNQLDRNVLQTKDSGLGVYNVSERIKAYFGEESSLEIDSIHGEGTTYHLKLKI
jgi:two-component system, sensor histidine kinase YesM